jgi:hypothetical protein
MVGCLPLALGIGANTAIDATSWLDLQVERLEERK